MKIKYKLVRIKKQKMQIRNYFEKKQINKNNTLRI